MLSRRVPLVLAALVVVTLLPAAASAAEFVDGADDVCITGLGEVIDRSACDASDRHADLSDVEISLSDLGVLTVDATSKGTDVETLAVVLYGDGQPVYSVQGQVYGGQLSSTRLVGGVPQPIGCEGDVSIATTGILGFLFLQVRDGCLDVGVAEEWSATVAVQRVVDDEVRTDVAPDVGTLPLVLTPFSPDFAEIDPFDDDGGPDADGVLRARDVRSSCTAIARDFVDVPEGVAHEGAILCLTERGVVAGFGDGTFRPREPVTVGQAAIMLERTLAEGGALLPPTTCGDGGAASTALAVLSQAGVLSTCDGEAVVTRSEMAGFVAAGLRAAGVATPSSSDWFTDDGAGEAASEHDALAELGIAIGTGGGAFSPDEPLTRGEAATFLVRMLDALLDA